MRNNKGSVALDLIVATSIIILIALTAFTCIRLNNMVATSNMQINEYTSKVITKLTQLENKSLSELGQLDDKEITEDSIKYEINCYESGHNTLRVEVTAIYNKLNYKFVIEKVYTE